MAAKPRRRARSKRPRVKSKPYNPTAPGFKTQGQYETAVKRRANAQIQPLLGDLNSEGRTEQRRNIGRTADIGRWAGFQTQAAQQGQQGVNDALTKLLGASGVYSGDANAALAGALRAQGEEQAQTARSLGVATPGQDPAVNDALAAYRTGNQLGLAGDFAGLIGTAGAQVGISGIQGREAADAERDRYAGITDELDRRRRDIRGRLPGILAETRSTINEEEQGKQAQRFQQGLARDQFGLSEKEFGLNRQNTRFQQRLASRTQGETERSNRASEGIQQGQLGVSQDQVANERLRIAADIQNAGSDADRKRAEDSGRAFNSGVEALQDFLKPTKPELRKNGSTKSTYKRSFRDAFETLTMQVGLSPAMAYRVLRTSKQFRRKADAALRARKVSKKNRGANKQGSPTRPSGGQ